MVQFSKTDVEEVGKDELILRLDELRASCAVAIANNKRVYKWIDSDLRIQSINHLRNVIQSILAMRLFHISIFPSQNFWGSFFVSVPTSTEFTDHYRELDILIRFSALHSQISLLESDVRSIVMALDPTACGGGTAKFPSVKNWLLARATTATQYQDFFELMRLTRNTIHNNGVHRPERGGDNTITYKGKIYEFKDAQPIKFADWNFVLFVGGEILEFLKTLTSDSIIATRSSL